MRTILKLLFAFACGFAGCFCWQYFRDCGIEPQVQQRIPTPKEIQELLVLKGYYIGSKGCDGVIGRDSRTAWDRAVCDQYAMEYFKGTEAVCRSETHQN